MIAKRLLVAFALAAVLAGGWSPSRETAAQEPSPIALDPQAAPADSTSDPAASPRPKLIRKGQGWHPIQVVPSDDADFEATVAKLNAAGFDAVVPSSDSVGATSNWIGVAPLPTWKTYAETAQQLKELLGDDAYINPPHDSPRKPLPHSFSCAKWRPKDAGAGAQQADLNRVVEGLAGSGLPIDVIDHDLRDDGSNYLFVIYSADAASEVEALLRTLVEKPTIWPSQPIVLGRKAPAATDPAAVPPASLPPSTTPLNVPVLDPESATPGSLLSPPPIETTPVAPTPDPSALPVNVDPAALLPTSPAANALSLPPSTTPIPDATSPAGDAPSLLRSTPPLNIPALDPASLPPGTAADPTLVEATPILSQLNPLTVPSGTNPNEFSPTIPGPGAATSNPLAPTEGILLPTAQVAENVEAPALAAKFVLLETDWTKANDLDEATELAGALTSGSFDLSKPETTIFRRGYASILSGDGARRLASDMESLGLVRVAGEPLQLNAQEPGSARTLAAIAATFPVKGRDGTSTPQAWTFLVVAEPYPDFSAITPVVPTEPPHGVQISIVGWRNASENASDGAAAGSATVPTPSRRYAGSLIIRSDQSALVPLYLPGIDGLTVLIAPETDGPAVQSLGPALPPGQSQALHTNSGLDWEAIIRGFESSSSTKAIPTIGAGNEVSSVATPDVAQEREDEFSIYVSPVDSEEMLRLQQAAVNWGFLVGNGEWLPNARRRGRLAVSVTAPTSSGAKIRDLVVETLPDKMVQVVRTAIVAEGALTWSPASEDDFEKVEKALQDWQGGYAARPLAKQLQGDHAEITIQVDPALYNSVDELVETTLPGTAVRFGEEGKRLVQCIVWLHYANATEIAEDFESHFPWSRDTAVADDRTNALIVTGDSLRDGGGRDALLGLLEDLNRPSQREPIADAPSLTSESSTETTPEPKDGYTISMRFVSQEDINRVAQALGTSGLSVDIFSTQLQGNGLGTIETKAPADAADKLYEFVKNLLPNATVQIGIQPFSPPHPGEADRVRKVLSWSPAHQDQLARVEQALLRSDLGIGVVAVQFQGDRALMEIETDADSSEAVLDLVRKAVPEATVRDEGVERPVERPVAEDRPEDGETVVVRLEYANAAEAAKIIETLKRDDDLRIAVDERTNSLFLSAPQKTKYRHIEEALELLRRLDVPEETPKVANRDLAFPIDRAANAADLRDELNRVEEQVKSVAAEASSLSDGARDEKIRSLRKLVTEAFRLRIELQREEAAELRDRLAKIETNLKRRERVEGAVVDRRIEVLLDPALEWPDLSLDETTPTPSSTTEPAATPVANPSGTVSDAASQFLQPWPNRLGSGDSFSAATTIAMEIARLNDELQTLTRNGAPPNSELRLALLQRQLDLLRQEFDARHQALQQELQAAKSKLRVAQTSWERLSALRDTGSVSAEETDRAQAELETAQAELARQEILLQQYDRAKSGMPEATPSEDDQRRAFFDALRTGKTPPDFPATPAASGLPSDVGGSATVGGLPTGQFSTQAPPSELLGSWELKKRVVMNEPEVESPRTFWTFNMFGLLVMESGTGNRHYGIENVAFDQFVTTHTVWEGDQGKIARAHRYRFEVSGDALRVVRWSDAADADASADPRPVAPGSDVIYYEFSRQPMPGSATSASTPSPEVATAPPLQGDGSAPEELQGVWKVTRSVSNGQELGSTDGGWRVYGPYAFSRTKDSSQDLTNIFRVVVDSSATPKRMEMHPIALPFEDYAHIQNIKPQHYLYEVEGDRLRLAARDWREHPENAYPAELAPGEGVHYMELERVGDADAIVPVDEGAPAADRTNWTLSTRTGLDHPSQRRDDQFAIATSLALRLAELSRRIKTLEAQPEASRDQGELDSARTSFDLLRQEFDARENAAKREFATAAESVAIAEARSQAAKKLYEAGQSTQWDYGTAQAAAYNARDEAKFHEALIGHYERARKTFAGSSESQGDADDSDSSSSSSEIQDAIRSLNGSWRLVRQSYGNQPHANSDEVAWTFEGRLLRVSWKSNSQVRERKVFELAFGSRPDEFRKLSLTDEGEESDRRVRFEFRDAQLHLVEQASADAKLGDRVEPAEGAYYYVFEKTRPSSQSELVLPSGESAQTPAELRGTWRMTKRTTTAESGPPKAPTTWRFSQDALRVAEAERAAKDYGVEFSPDSPGTLRTVRFVTTSWGRVPAENGFHARYEILGEGDALRVAVGGFPPNRVPDSFAPRQFVDIFEFERVAESENAAPQATETEGVAPTAPPNVAAPNVSTSSNDGAPPTTPSELQGAWKLIEQSEGQDSVAVEGENVWVFEPRLLRTYAVRPGDDGRYLQLFELRVPGSESNELQRTSLTTGLMRDRAWIALRYEFRDGRLCILVQNNRNYTFPNRIEPWTGFKYYVFEKTDASAWPAPVSAKGDAALVPTNLQGRWRLTKREAHDPSDSERPYKTWTFGEDSLTEFDGQRFHPYATEFPPDSPGTLRTAAVFAASWGPVPWADAIPCRYEVAADGDLLRVARFTGRKGLDVPEKVEPGEGIEYLEFRRETLDETTAVVSGTAVPKELLGTWRMKSYQAADEANTEIESAEWTFDAKTLQIRRDGEVARYAMEFVETPEGSPAEFGALRVMRTAPENREVYYPGFVARFELSGDSLRVVQAKERQLLPPDVAAWKDAIYYEFERVADAAVPPELIGTWRLRKHVVESAPEAKVTFTTWTFDETTLGMDTSEKNREERYEVVSSPDSPGTFRTYKFHELPAGIALEGSVLCIRYAVEGEGERLKVAFGGGAGPPETVAPDAGVIYYEFERVNPIAATDAAHGDDALIALPTDKHGTAPQADGASSAKEGAAAPMALEGTWLLDRHSLGDDRQALLAVTTWTFDGERLIETRTPKDGETTVQEFRIERSTDLPGGFAKIEASGARRLARYEREGPKLRVTLRASPETTTFPADTKPNDSDHYLEFAWVGESRVSPELIGTWRVTRLIDESAFEAQAQVANWTFAGTALTMHGTKQERVTYTLVLPRDDDDSFRTFRYTHWPASTIFGNRILDVRYEVSGDVLKAAFADSDTALEKAAPGPGVFYFEFERAKDAARKSLDADAPSPSESDGGSVDEGGRATSLPAESAGGL